MTTPQTSTSTIRLTLPVSVAEPETGFLAQHWNTGPRGTLTVNSRYLERDGQPWLPIMGEFHYSRYPADEWEAELRKMKAGGVQIVASYVFWNHHEENTGQFDWQGNKDLRRFVQLVDQVGLLFSLRVGPWVHAEARNGGFPDWLLQLPQLRCNAADYLAHVTRFYGEIGQQVDGLMWQAGGPVVTVQLENEYDRTGPNCGAEHIAALKQIAIEAGLKVPFYTVTGWPTLDIPPREVIPVSGAYADGFWSGETGPLPASGVFLFNTDRAIGEMGNVGGTPASGQIDKRHYPFFLAEAGGGMHMSYHRRPVVTADDVTATALTQLGSGANLYGYYMYHGGTNPVGEHGWLNETQDTGYPNDVPQLGYDFHAPLGQYGQVRTSFGRLATLHHFVAAYGASLATMDAKLRDDAPIDPADKTRLRVCGRGDGTSGFVFVNNHVRHHPMPLFAGVQLQVELADQTIAIPAQPVDVPAGAFFIWPVMQRLGGVVLRYATAQPLTRFADAAGTCAVYFATSNIPVEFCFDADSVAAVEAASSSVLVEESVITIRHSTGDEAGCFSLTDHAGQRHTVIVLSQQIAERCTPIKLHGRWRLAWGQSGSLYQEGEALVVGAGSDGMARVAIYPADDLHGGEANGQGAFTLFSQTVSAAAPVKVATTLLRLATPQPLRFGPPISWRKAPVPTAPDDAIYQHAGVWRISLPNDIDPAAGRLLLQIDYAGDAARLYADGVLIDDQFYDGDVFEVALDRLYPTGAQGKPVLELHILPTHQDAPIFIESSAQAKLAKASAGAHLNNVQLVSQRTARLGFERQPAVPATQAEQSSLETSTWRA